MSRRSLVCTRFCIALLLSLVAAASTAETHVYGYLLATVNPRDGDAADPIQFTFMELSEKDVRPKVLRRYGPEFVHGCYEGNARP